MAFVSSGPPPSSDDIDDHIRANQQTPADIRAELWRQDMIVFDESGAVRAAYPLSPMPTEQRVSWSAGPELFAMCAIDALGVSAMLNRPVIIEALEPVPGERVRVKVDRTVASWEPQTVVVYAGADGDGCCPSVDETCSCVNFFTTRAAAEPGAREPSPGHPLRPGRRSGPDVRGGRVRIAAWAAVSETRVRHPVLERVYARLSHRMEKELGAQRSHLLAHLTGCVIEVGPGNGMNFAHYPPGVDHVLAVEPEPHLRTLGTEAAAHASTTIVAVDGTAEQLPVVYQHFDAAVVSLALCSVREPAAALAEIRRSYTQVASCDSSSTCELTAVSLARCSVLSTRPCGPFWPAGATATETPRTPSRCPAWRSPNACRSGFRTCGSPRRRPRMCQASPSKRCRRLPEVGRKSSWAP